MLPLASLCSPCSRYTCPPTSHFDLPLSPSIKQDGDEVRQCLNCHNNSCVRVKRRKRFELFWIPLIPFKAKHAWMCGICSAYTAAAVFPSSSRPA
ncbi:hypothetical protein DMC30DRAFT_394871, partial [Rhodotorula diobovata]